MAKDALSSTLSNLSQLENFFFTLAHELPNQKKNFKKRQDITAHLKKSNIQIPELLQDEPIVWLGVGAKHIDDDDTNATSISIVRPGNPAALGLTIGCVGFGGWRVCLECEWLICRIVITGRF